jgi:hypothetical protein
MSDWTARYEEGYLTDAGANVTITDSLYRDQLWRSARAALQYWKSTGLEGPGVHAYGNGLEQTVNVGDRAEFVAVHVSTIWRRVSFVSAGNANDDVERSMRSSNAATR